MKWVLFSADNLEVVLESLIVLQISCLQASV
jgi:hypothetical protein